MNIAINMLMHAVDGICDQQVLFSNDGDCVPALQMIRHRYPTVQLGVVAPLIVLRQMGLGPLSPVANSTHEVGKSALKRGIQLSR